MTTLRVLFVGTGPVSKHLPPCQQYEDFKEMKRDFKKRGCSFLFEECIMNNVIEEIHGQPSIYMSDIPKPYWSFFINNDIIHHDLDNHRKLLIKKIKTLYPDVTKIIYKSVDMYIVSPEFCDCTEFVRKIDKTFSKKDKFELMEIVRKTDKTFSQKYGVEFIYSKHYKMQFQEYIETHDCKYDIVCFVGCCHPHYLINRKKSYTANFRNILASNGYIMYADPTDEGFNFINMDDRLDNLHNISYSDSDDEPDSEEKDIASSKVNYLLKHLENVEPGVYKFLPDKKKK